MAIQWEQGEADWRDLVIAGQMEVDSSGIRKREKAYDSGSLRLCLGTHGTEIQGEGSTLVVKGRARFNLELG